MCNDDIGVSETMQRVTSRQVVASQLIPMVRIRSFEDMLFFLYTVITFKYVVAGPGQSGSEVV